MPRQQWNTGQEIASVDLSKASLALERELYDRVLYELMNRQADVVFDDSFKVEYLSALQATLRAGTGIQNDGTQVNPEPTKRLLYRSGSVTKSLAAADASNNRIDIISIKAARVDVVSESKNIKAIDGTVTPTSVVTQTDWESDIVVTTGTPSGSPAVPSTPAGYIKLAEILVTAVTGMSGASAVTDKRPRYKRQTSTKRFATKVAAYTVDIDDETLYADLTGGTFAFALPAPGLCPGHRFTFKKIDASANALTFSRNFDGASQTIDVQNSSLTVESDGTGYNIV